MNTINKKQSKVKEVATIIVGIIGIATLLGAWVHNSQSQLMANRKINAEERTQFVTSCKEAVAEVGAADTTCDCMIDFLNEKYTALQIQNMAQHTNLFNEGTPELQEAVAACARR